MSRSVLILSVIAAFVCGVVGQACPGARPPPLSRELSGALYRARPLGYVPNDNTLATAANVQRVKRLLPQKDFDYLFPLANEGKGPTNTPYNYKNFLMAVALFPDFCNNATSSMGSLDKACLNELSTLFAMFAQEVGAHIPSSQTPIPEWRQGLYYINEIGCPPPNGGSACMYCQDPNVYNYPCVAGQYYFGRGPLQLSWNYNYGFFSQVVYGDPMVLLKNPSKLTSKTDTSATWLAIAASLWFYMTPQNPKPSMHDVATGFWQPNSADIAANRKQGFGVQTMIINGGLECGGSQESKHSQNRIDYYKGFTNYFGISAGSNLGCAQMKLFDSTSSAAVPQHWERSWNEDCACNLVSYTTEWSVYQNQDISKTYQKCLDHHFSGMTVAPSQKTTAKPGGNDKTTAKPGGIDCNNLPSCANNCSVCKYAVGCTEQQVTDNDCKPCATGQSWWPCNTNPPICYCAKYKI